MKKHPLSDLDAEVRDHIARETQDNIEKGMAPEEAHYAALRKFGNVMLAEENARAVWIPVWLDQFRQHARYGLRMLHHCSLLRRPRESIRSSRSDMSSLVHGRYLDE